MQHNEQIQKNPGQSAPVQRQAQGPGLMNNIGYLFARGPHRQQVEGPISQEQKAKLAAQSRQAEEQFHGGRGLLRPVRGILQAPVRLLAASITVPAGLTVGTVRATTGGIKNVITGTGELLMEIAEGGSRAAYLSRKGLTSDQILKDNQVVRLSNGELMDRGEAERRTQPDGTLCM